MIYSLSRITCFGQGRPSSGHQEPGYALYNICFSYVGHCSEGWRFRLLSERKQLKIVSQSGQYNNMNLT
jgi:hypothetical protein